MAPHDHPFPGRPGRDQTHDHAHDGEHLHAHDRGHGHVHAHAPTAIGRAFLIGIAVNCVYLIAEAAFGVAVNSLALIADAAHNLGDVLALGAAWGALVLAKRLPSARYTYGLRRSSILAALSNAIVLLIVTGGVAWEAIIRLFAPASTGGAIIMAVAAAGIVVNGGTALLFMGGRRGDLNVQAAFQHMAADALVALGVVFAGGLIMITGWPWLDPAVSLIVSAVIVVTTWSLLRELVNLSLDAVPEHIDRAAVERYLTSVPGVLEVHDLHIWGLSTTETALTVHLICAPGADRDMLLLRVCTEAQTGFGIGHATVQLETEALARQCELRPDHVV